VTGRPIKGAAIRATTLAGIPMSSRDFRTARRLGHVGLGAGLAGDGQRTGIRQIVTLPWRVSVLEPNPDVRFILVGRANCRPLEGIDTNALQGDLAHATS